MKKQIPIFTGGANHLLSLLSGKLAFRVFLITIFIILSFIGNAYAITTTTTLYNVASVELTPTNGTSDSAYNSAYTNQLIPSGNTAITRIKFRLMYKGPSWLNYGHASVTLCHPGSYIDPGPKSNGAPTILLADRYYREATNETIPNVWYNYEITIDPLNGEGCGNRYIYFYVNSDSRGDGPWRIEILEITYASYDWENIGISVTSDRYAQISVSRSEKVPYSHYIVINSTDGNRTVVNINSSSTVSSFNAIDTLVQPEKTYSYVIKSGIGSSDDSTAQIYNGSIKIPSDATYACEYALAAKTAAENASNYAQIAVNQTLYNGQSAAYWAYQATQVAAQAANTPPIITKVQGQNGATCTRSTSFTLFITASDNGPPSNIRYRVICGSFDSGWSSSNVLTVTGLSVPGAKTATIMVSDNPNAPDSGNIAQTTFTFFKI